MKLKVFIYVAIGLAIYFVGMFVGETQSPDATAVRQNGSLQSQLSSCITLTQKVCSDLDAQDKALIELGAPADQVTLHCTSVPSSTLQ